MLVRATGRCFSLNRTILPPNRGIHRIPHRLFTTGIVTCNSDSYKRSNLPSINAQNPYREVKPARVGAPEIDDQLLIKIRNACDAQEILDLIPIGKQPMSKEAVMAAVSSLFQLQKSTHLSLPSRDVLDHPKFHTLCTKVKKFAPNLTENNIIDLIKIFNFLGVESNSEIFLVLLNLIRYQINELTLDHIVFLDFILQKLKTVPVVEALKMALPMLFQIHLNNQLDYDNLPRLMVYFNYATNNIQYINNKSLNSLVSAITLHSHELNAIDAKQIVWSLSRLDCIEPIGERLLNNSFSTLCKNVKELKLNDLELLVSKMTIKCAEGQDEFYNEEFLSLVIEEIIINSADFLNSCHLLMDLLRINYVSIPLLNYIADKIDQSPDVLIQAAPRTVFTLVSAFSAANYKPINWHSIILPAIDKNDIFLMINRTGWHWLKLFAELVTLDYTDLTYVRKVMSEQYLDQYFAQHSSDLDHLQLLNLYQAVTCRAENPLEAINCQSYIDKAIQLNLKFAECKLREFFEMELGKNLVLSRIITKYGHFVQHVIVRKLDTGEFVDVEHFKTEAAQTGGFIQFEAIECKEDEQMIAINLVPNRHYVRNLPKVKGIFARNARELQHLGLSVINISELEWSQLLEHERIPYLMREIKTKFNSD